MALFPHPDRSREASLEMLQTLRRIAPSKSLLAGTLAARRWNRFFGSNLFWKVLFVSVLEIPPENCAPLSKAGFPSSRCSALLQRVSVVRKTEKMLSVATNKRRVLLCTLRAESNLASMGQYNLLCEHSRSNQSSDKRAMRWMSLTRPVSPRSLHSGFELSLSP